MSDEHENDELDDDPMAGKAGKMPDKKGPLAWFARNAVAANILMILLLVGGYIKMGSMKQEVFPEFSLDMIIVNVPYPGASPSEVESGVVLAVEEQLRGIDGIKEVRASAVEGMAVVTASLLLGANPDQALNDTKAAVDRITSLPERAERPVVFMGRIRNQVISIALYGDSDLKTLKALGEKIRDDLLKDPKITVVEFSGVKPLEISIEVPQRNLRKYNLTLEQIAGLIRQSSVEIPGGGIKTARGEILVRTAQRRKTGKEFERLTLISLPDGTSLTLGDIATIKDGFAESDIEARFNGKPALMINVFRVGDQKPLEITGSVKAYMARVEKTLPPGVKLSVWFDMSELYAQRLDLLLRNAAFGLVLVLIILGLFLEVRLAFWVTLGIPISFIGALLILPSTGVSLNMLSLFAFIVVLGMVVDDAIIVGESIYHRRQDGWSRMDAAIYGLKEVALPVTFAVITTVMAYMPMLFVPGIMGKFFRVIPIVVIAVLLLSLLESLVILPAHLAHSKRPSDHGILGRIHRVQQRFSQGVERFIEHQYKPVVAWAVRNRYLTGATCLAIFLGSCGMVAGGRLDMEQFPKVEGDIVVAQVHLPYGTSIDRTKQVEAKMLIAAREVIADNGGEAEIVRGIFSLVGTGAMIGMNDPSFPTASTGSHVAEVSVYLVESAKRDVRAREFASQWRKKLDRVPGVEKVILQFDTGPTAGAAVHIELNHRDMSVIYAAAKDLAKRLDEFEGVGDIDDGFTDGKDQLDLRLTPEGRSVGLTELELARQVRASFFGAEAARDQRGRDELRVYVRLPRDERASEYNIEQLMLRTPGGGEIPFEQAAIMTRGKSYTAIKRIDGRQAVAVTANVDSSMANAEEVMTRVRKEVLPGLVAKHPGLTYTIGGEQKEADDMNKSLLVGFILAVLGMFALLAIAFKSYFQPLIILIAIPFGIVGAIWGHVLMGYNLSMMSMMGIVALSGVVVNDSLILIVSVNRYRGAGQTAFEAVVNGAGRRFRPIILTSLTTFFGLAPMILETSMQARFLIPMAISLGFGVMFATVITLLLVPSVYMMLDDASRGLRWLIRLWNGPDVVPDERDEPEPVVSSWIG